MFVAVFLIGAPAAWAHQTGTSMYVAHVQPAAGVVETVLTFPAIDLVDHLGRDDGDHAVSDEEWTSAHPEMTKYLASAVSVESGGACASREVKLQLVEAQAVYLNVFECEPWGQTVVLRNAAMTEMTNGYAHVGRVQVGDGDEEVTAFNGAFPTYEVAMPGGTKVAPPDTLDVVLRFIWQGILHIVLGLDHILFVLGLLLISRNGRRLLAVVTAFTLSHSVTLAISTLGVFSLPASVVEPLIAASILYVAVEAFQQAERREAEQRARIVFAATFALGLMHGFGFSYVLADVGLPEGKIAPALFAFNVGVELGQLGFIAVLWPLRRWLSGKEWEARVLRACAILLGLCAVFWLVQRLM